MGVRKKVGASLVGAGAGLALVATIAACVGDDPSNGSEPAPAEGGTPDSGTPDTGGTDGGTDTGIDGGGDAGPPPPAAVSYYGITEFAAADQAYVRIPYLTKLYDDRNEYDPVAGRFVAAYAGDYHVCVSLIFPAASYFQLYVSKNGARIGLGIGLGPAVQGCATLRLAKGEYLEPQVRHGANMPLTVTASDAWSYFTVSSVDARVALTNVAPGPIHSSMTNRVPYTNELFDVANEFDTGASRLTAAAAGDYHVCASAFILPNAELCIESNNAAANKCIGSGTAGLRWGCRVERLTVGQTLDVILWQYSGSDAALAADPVFNWMTASRVEGRVELEGITPLTVPPGTNTKIPYITEVYDDKNEFDPGQSRFVASEAGDYEVCASLSKDASTYFELYLYLNGVLERGIGVGMGPVTGCRTVRLKVGDIVEIWARTGVSVSFENTATPGWNWMTVTKMR